MAEKQYNKLIDNIIKTAITAELKGITKEEIINRYNECLEKHGIEKAESALKHTLKQFKERANKKEKEFWNSVKNETFNKLNFCPCAISELKRMITAGEINITGFTKEQEIKQRLNIK
jgi:hypothetical protein